MEAPSIDLTNSGLKRATASAYRAVLAAEENHGPLPLALHQQLGILTEEVGEVAQAINEHLWTSPDHSAIRDELAQVAAVALRMIAALDRRTIPSPQNH